MKLLKALILTGISSFCFAGGFSGTTGGGGTPAAPLGAVQFNSTGTFNGSASFTTNGSSVTVSTMVVNGPLTVAGTATISKTGFTQLIINGLSSTPPFAGVSFQATNSEFGHLRQENANLLCSDLSTVCMTNPLQFGPSAGTYNFGIDTNGKLSVGSGTGSRSTATVWGNLLVGSGYSTVTNAPTDGLRVKGPVMFDSSETVTGSGGLGVTYGAVLGSATLSNVASGTQCLHADSSGHVTGTGSDCGSGGGGGSSSSLEILAGVRVTSPTATLAFGSGFVGTATTASTATITFATNNPVITTLSASSITVTGTGVTAQSYTANGSGAGDFVATEASFTVTPPASGTDIFWADSGSHTFVFNPNNTSTYVVVGSSINPTVGHLAAWSNAGTLIDGGTGSTGGSGGYNLQPSSITPNFQYGVQETSETATAFQASLTSFSVVGVAGFAVVSSSAGQISMTEGAQSTVVGNGSGIDTIWGDSTAHALLTNYNGGASTGTIVTSTGTPTAGHLSVFGTGSGTIVDAGTNISVSTLTVSGASFSSLGGSSPNGSFQYCTDCTVTTPATCVGVISAACVCAGSGSGAFAKRLNSQWFCN